MLLISNYSAVWIICIIVFCLFLCLLIFWPSVREEVFGSGNGTVPKMENPPEPPYYFDGIFSKIAAQQIPEKEFSGRFRVVDGKLDFDCTTRNISFEEVRVNLIKLRDELNRQIANETNCPYYKTNDFKIHGDFPFIITPPGSSFPVTTT